MFDKIADTVFVTEYFMDSVLIWLLYLTKVECLSNQLNKNYRNLNKCIICNQIYPIIIIKDYYTKYNF